MKILSIISEGELFISPSQDPISLHPDQLVVTALELLLDHDKEALPIRKNGKDIGIVYIKDLIWFLTENEAESNLLFHKFNFDLYTAIKMIRVKADKSIK